MEAIALLLNEMRLRAEPDLTIYDRFDVAVSGGKDSVAILLHLIERGVPRERIYVTHNHVDGREGSRLMDWACTPAYVVKLCEALGVSLIHSWRVGGFEGELLKENALSGAIRWEDEDGWLDEYAGSPSAKPRTRRMWPAKRADLRYRWCSSALKIEPFRRMLNRDERYHGKKVLVVTGERAEESKSRAKYATFERHACDSRGGAKERHVDHWRPVHGWSETEVWAIMRRHNINPHPAYRLGWGRTSCRACIFGSKAQWASLRKVDPEGFERIAKLEETLGHTIDNKRTVREMADRGTPYSTITESEAREAMNEEWNGPIFVENWKLPAGAYGDNAGPV